MISTRNAGQTERTYTLQQEIDLWRNMDELFGPEVVFRVSDQLDESHQNTPGMWPMSNEAFQEHLRHHFPEPVILHFREEMKQQTAEPMCVRIRIAQVKYGCAEQVMLA